MYCPSCGAEERQPSQFCRACGTDMRMVRTALQKPDAITDSAIAARNEIGRAIATKIQELKNTKDLKKVVEEVLPEVEKFLESPEARRLRRLRAGVITAAVGLGVMITLMLSPGIGKLIVPLMFIGWPAGLIIFLIGIGIIINGLLFSMPSMQVPDYTQAALTQNRLDQLVGPVKNTGNLEVSPQQYLDPPPSVTENTTRQLPDQVVPRPKITQ